MIEAFIRRGKAMSELCAEYGVSRKTGYKWLERFATEGVSGLDDRSRARKTQPDAVAEAVVERLVEVRRTFPKWGPRKVVAWLGEREPGLDLPAASTCGDILKRAGLVESRKRARPGPRRVAPPAVYAAPNAVWCTDFKGDFRMQDGRRCCPLTLTDGFSRKLLRCQGHVSTALEPCRPVFESAFREYGLPLAMRSDNGAPFASAGLGGLTRLSVWWLKLGITLEHIVPGHPEQNGRHERMHRTLKDETACPPRANMAEQQAAFDAFRSCYNDERPHEALGQKPPSSAYQASPRPYPDRVEAPEYPAFYEVRRVRPDGSIKWRGEHIYVSEALVREPVGLEPVADGIWLLHFAAAQLGTLDERDRGAKRRISAYAPGLRPWLQNWWSDA